MANGNPILVCSNESDIWIGDFPLAHLVGPVVYLDPPFATMSGHSSPIDNERAHLLLLPAENCRASRRTHPAASTQRGQAKARRAATGQTANFG